MTSTTIEPAVSRAPRASARWVIKPTPDPEAVAALAAALSLPNDVANLLLIRGHSDPEAARRFLRPRLEHLHDGFSMKGLAKAVDRLARACATGETVLVHGDYDVDGICSTTIMIRTLREFGAKAVPFIPRRIEDGYDLGQAGVRAAKENHASVVVTCDCGTSAREPIAELCSEGIDVIVTDHHLPGEALPDCLAVLNPQQEGCEYPDKHLAAVGVAFKLALALAKHLGKNDAFIWGMLDLVALATVADVAKLDGENRVMVRYGLRMLSETRNIGLRSLIRAAGMEGKELTAGRVGYILAPRLNAVGRLGHAMRGVELLMSDNEHDANAIARELEELNARRQELDRRTLEEAREMLAEVNLGETYGIVLAKEGWHPGVIGIVASRIVEEFGRPVMLIALDGESGKGSGRSIGPFDLHGALAQCSGLLTRFGGHRMAAGITIRRDRVAEFAARFNQVARASLTPEQLVPEIRIDLEVGIDGNNDEMERLLRHFEPFGMGNPTPVLVARGVRLVAPPKLIGRDGLRLRLSAGNGELEAIGWGFAPRIAEFDPGIPLDIAFRLERDEYRGLSRLQARIADITPQTAP
ncbi:MAG: single-stranded-DNA-specific exonuclease RecJ, partial [Gemmatimonadales bacterium]